MRLKYASVSIQSSEALAKLSIEQPRELSDVTGATRDVQSPDTRLGTGQRDAHRVERAKAPEPSATDHPTAPPPGGPSDFPSNNTGSRRTRREYLPMSYGRRHRLIRFRTLGLPIVSYVMCPTRQAYAPTPPLSGAGRTTSASAGPGERHPSSSAPARRRRPTANAISGSSRASLQIGGGLRRYAPLEEISGEPMSP